MTDVNHAKFTINGSASADANGNRGYTATNSESLTLTAEDNPSSALSFLYEVYSSADSDSPLASKDADAITFTDSGTYQQIMSNPNGNATITMPSSGAHSYIIRCTATVAGGSDTYERMVVILRTAPTPDLRKTVPGESNQYVARGFSDALNDIVDAVGSAAGFSSLDDAYTGGQAIDVDSGKIDVTGTTTTDMLSLIATPGASSTATVLHVEAAGTNWASGARAVNIVSDDNDAIPLVINDGGSDVITMERAGNILLDGNLTLTSGGTLQTTANGDIIIAPNGTGITRYGTEVTSQSYNAPGDVVLDRLEVNTEIRCDGNLFVSGWGRFHDNAEQYFGDSDDAVIMYDTAQTPDALFLGVSTDSRVLIIAERVDKGTDLSHAQQTNPTVYIHSADVTDTAQWISLAHDQTDGILSAGTGLKLTTGANGDLEFNPNGTGSVVSSADVFLANSKKIYYGPSTADPAIYGDGFYGIVVYQSSDITAGDFFQITSDAAAELDGSSGSQSFVKITPEIGQSSTAGYKAIEVDVTETSTGSGTNLLLDLMVGSSSAFYVDNSGNVVMDGDITLTSGGTIQTTSNGDITIDPNGTGTNILGANTFMDGNSLYFGSATTSPSIYKGSETDSLYIRQNTDLSSVDFLIITADAGADLTASSGSQTFVKISPVIEQTSTAGYTILEGYSLEDSTGSGDSYLLDFGVGGTREFSVTTGGLTTVGDVIRGSSSLWYNYRQVAVSSIDPGASGATWVDPSANTVGGWQLDASSETLEFQADIHDDWDGASDIKICVYFETNIDNSGGSGTDSVDMQIVCRMKTVGESSCKTQTLETAKTVGTAAQYTMFESEFYLDYDDVSNPVETNDIIGFQLNLETDTSEVDDIIINHIEILYQSANVRIEI